MPSAACSFCAFSRALAVARLGRLGGARVDRVLLLEQRRQLVLGVVHLAVERRQVGHRLVGAALELGGRGLGLVLQRLALVELLGEAVDRLADRRHRLLDLGQVLGDEILVELDLAQLAARQRRRAQDLVQLLEPAVERRQVEIDLVVLLGLDRRLQLGDDVLPLRIEGGAHLADLRGDHLGLLELGRRFRVRRPWTMSPGVAWARFSMAGRPPPRGIDLGAIEQGEQPGLVEHGDAELARPCRACCRPPRRRRRSRSSSTPSRRPCRRATSIISLASSRRQRRQRAGEDEGLAGERLGRRARRPSLSSQVDAGRRAAARPPRGCAARAKKAWTLSATIGPTSATSSSCSTLASMQPRRACRSAAPGPSPSSRRRGGCRGRRGSAAASSSWLASSAASRLAALLSAMRSRPSSCS